MRGPRTRRTLLCCAIALVLPAATAHAATDGLLAFEQGSAPARSLATIDPATPGAATTVLDHLPADPADAAWSPDGARLAFSAVASGVRNIYVMAADGSGLRAVTSDPVAALDPTWSPDGTRLAFTSLRGGRPDISVVDLAGGAPRQLTTDAGTDQQADWSPDGSLIAFESDRGGSLAIWTMAPDGSAQQQLTHGPGEQVEADWGPGGSRLAYAAGAAGQRSLYSVDRVGGDVRQLTPAGLPADFPAWSPDGDRIAFVSFGAIELIPATGASDSGKVSSVTIGSDPSWAPLAAPAAIPAGDVTVNGAPVAAGAPLPALTTGTRVDATDGSLLVSFRRPGLPAAVPPSNARVDGTAFTVLGRTASEITLRLKSPGCTATTRAGAGLARRRHRHRAHVSVDHGHYRLIDKHVTLGSYGTSYRVSVSCRGTTVAVRSGLVYARPHHGARRIVKLRAGQKRFFPAFP